MPRGRPVDNHQRARVRELHKQGLSRNEIARLLEMSSSTVSNIARDAGLSFDRTKTEQATAAKVADAKARRAELAELLIDDAHRLRQRLWEPAQQVLGSIEGPQIITLDLPTAREAKDFMAAVNGASKGHLDLVRHDADAGTDGARSMLGGLAAALAAVAEGLPDEPGSGNPGPVPETDP